MLESLVDLIRCPITRGSLRIKIIKKAKKELDGRIVETIAEGILYDESDWFFPIINGIPRLITEAVFDYEDFLLKNMPDYLHKKEKLMAKYGTFINMVSKKNRRTKQSFTQEWGIFDYETDKTWNADEQKMVERFYNESGETLNTLQNKIILDAGCGNGLLNSALAKQGITNIAMDLSNAIEKAYDKNLYSKVHFIQADVQFPPFAFNYFDIVHCSGVLIHTNNSELTFSCISQLVRPQGKLSVWLYHPRNNLVHNLFNCIRKITAIFPLRFQYYCYRCTIFPVSYIIKKIKGNSQNSREMMVDILDWFTPEFRWEHTHEEVEIWFYKNNFDNIKTTTDEVFGFNTVGIKNNKN